VIIRVDIDETICDTPYCMDDNGSLKREYHNSVPAIESIAKINRLYEAGHTIIYWTSRGSRTKINWRELTEKQLSNWEAKYHELHLDKPYYDLIIDDKAKIIEDI
jgi:hypothetical protein